MDEPQVINGTKFDDTLVSLSRSAIVASALAICLTVLPTLSAQNRPDEHRQPNVNESPYGETPYGPDVPDSQQPRGDHQQDQSAAAAAPDALAPNPEAPAELQLPSGTIVAVRTTQWLSSDQNHPGDTFRATLEQPLVVNGWVVARRGQSVIGRVAVAEKAGRGKNNSQLGLELSELILVDGQQVPVNSELIQNATGGSSDRQVVTVAATTAIGAVIGAVAGGGQGAAIGAVVGAGAGIAGVMSTRGRPTVLAPEALLTFRLESPVEVLTERSRVAFRPATASDYGNADPHGARPAKHVLREPSYPPRAYYYDGGGYYGYPYLYPSTLYFGFYGGRSFGYPWGYRGGFRR